MLVWKFLHILSMFAGVTLLFTYEIVIHRAAVANEILVVRSVGKRRTRIENSGIALIVLGIVFGVITALVGPYDLTQGWLLTAYGLVAVLIALGAGPETAWLNRLVAAAEADPGEGSSEGYVAAMRDPRRNLIWVSAALYAAVIFVMVTKPFS